MEVLSTLATQTASKSLLPVIIHLSEVTEEFFPLHV